MEETVIDSERCRFESCVCLFHSLLESGLFLECVGCANSAIHEASSGKCEVALTVPGVPGSLGWPAAEGRC